MINNGVPCFPANLTSSFFILFQFNLLRMIRYNFIIQPQTTFNYQFTNLDFLFPRPIQCTTSAGYPFFVAFWSRARLNLRFATSTASMRKRRQRHTWSTHAFGVPCTWGWNNRISSNKMPRTVHCTKKVVSPCILLRIIDCLSSSSFLIISTYSLSFPWILATM